MSSNKGIENELMTSSSSVQYVFLLFIIVDFINLPSISSFCIGLMFFSLFSNTE